MQVFYNGSKDSVDGYICHKRAHSKIVERKQWIEERPESQSKPKVDRN